MWSPLSHIYLLPSILTIKVQPALHASTALIHHLASCRIVALTSVALLCVLAPKLESWMEWAVVQTPLSQAEARCEQSFQRRPKTQPPSYQCSQVVTPSSLCTFHAVN